MIFLPLFLLLAGSPVLAQWELLPGQNAAPHVREYLLYGANDSIMVCGGHTFNFTTSQWDTLVASNMIDWNQIYIIDSLLFWCSSSALPKISYDTGHTWETLDQNFYAITKFNDTLWVSGDMYCGFTTDLQNYKTFDVDMPYLTHIQVDSSAIFLGNTAWCTVTSHVLVSYDRGQNWELYLGGANSEGYYFLHDMVLYNGSLYTFGNFFRYDDNPPATTILWRNEQIIRQYVGSNMFGRLHVSNGLIVMIQNDSAFNAVQDFSASTDGGASWNDIHFNMSYDVTGIARHDQTLYASFAITDHEGHIFSLPLDELQNIAQQNRPTPKYGQTRLRIAPNPFNGSATLHYSATQNSREELRIFNMLGQVVYRELLPWQQEGKTLEQPLSMEHLPSGTYLLQVGNACERITLLK